MKTLLPSSLTPKKRLAGPLPEEIRLSDPSSYWYTSLTPFESGGTNALEVSK